MGNSLRRSGIAILFVLAQALSAAEGGPAKSSPLYLDLSLGPLVGIDRPLKGCSGALALGLCFPPFQACVRAGAAYDRGFESGLLKFDATLGLGGGFHAVVGWLLPLGDIGIPDPTGESDERIPLGVGSAPSRFGLGSTIFDLPWPMLGALAALEAELVYTAYRIESGDSSAKSSDRAALSGAAAFAAGVEATLVLRLRWGGGAAARR